MRGQHRLCEPQDELLIGAAELLDVFPATRMKMGELHIVPLCQQAVAILQFATLILFKRIATLEAKGKPIGPLDTLIASHALSIKAAVVTNNVREFSRVGLRAENWIND